MTITANDPTITQQPRVTIAIQQDPSAADLPLPHYATTGSAGMDLHANLTEDMIMAPGARAAIPTGLSMALPVTHEAQIRPRSGLAIKQGLTVVNAPGTIDSDYRGDIAVLMINLGDAPITIHRGMRIAQMVIAPVTKCSWQLVDSLDDSERGAGGFGSTGV